MAYVQKVVKVFDKGIVDELGDEAIPAGTASAANNFLDLGDRIELVRGQLRLGNLTMGPSKITGLAKATDTAGNEFIYRKRTTILERYIPATETWSSVITGLPADEDLSHALYRSPAGAFIWFSSPNSGLYRINLANPDTYVDLYDVAKNHKGYITIEDNRMWLVKGDSIVYISYIDNDWPYTPITAESLGTGDGSTVTFATTLVHPLVVGISLAVTAGAVTGTDDGTGTITGTGITGTINYTTGAISVTFDTAPAGAVAIEADYSYEQPKSEGLADFTYGSPRAAGQGSFFFQGQSNDAALAVLPYDEKFYTPHTNSMWLIDLTADDTEATNKIYRDNTGIPNPRAAKSTGDGIYYLDKADSSNIELRLLKYNEVASKVLPVSISDQLDLTGCNISDAVIEEFGDYIIFSLRSSDDVSYNDMIVLYNKKWKLFNKMDATVRNFTIYGDKLYGGSSVDANVYELFSGFDDDGSVIAGSWEANDWTLDADELKKCKRFVVEGDIAESQELIVELAFDGDDFEEVGRIAGDSQYVDRGTSTQYGTTLYGSGSTYGSGEYVEAYRYMREFRISSGKFYRVKARFKTEEFGYLNIRQYIFRDIRDNLARVPTKFR
jgi:hypothetical protein